MDTKFSLLTHRALLRAAAPVIWPGGKNPAPCILVVGLLCGVLLGLRGNKLVQAGAAALGDVRQLVLLAAAVFGILYGGYACSGRALEKKTGRAAPKPFRGRRMHPDGIWRGGNALFQRAL